MIDVAIGISGVMNLLIRRVFTDSLCLGGAPVMEFGFWELLLMRQLNMFNINCAITPSPSLPRSLSREGRGKFKPLSLDGRGVEERVVVPPYLIVASIKTVASGRNSCRGADAYPVYGAHRRHEVRPRSRFLEVLSPLTPPFHPPVATGKLTRCANPTRQSRRTRRVKQIR